VEQTVHFEVRGAQVRAASPHARPRT